MTAFPGLKDTLYSWWQEACAGWLNYAKQQPFSGFESWREFTRRTFLRSALDLTSWEAVCGILNDDLCLKAQVDHTVGSVLWRKRIEVVDIAEAFSVAAVDQYERNGLTAGISDELFERTFLPIDDFFASEAVTYDAIAPILGLQVERTPIRLTESVWIEELDLAEQVGSVDTLVMLELAYREMTHGMREFPSYLKHVFRSTFALPKLIDPILDEEKASSEAVAIYQKVEAAQRNCIRAIAITTAPRILAWPVRIAERGWRRSKSGIGLSMPPLSIRLDAPGAMIMAASEPTLRLAWEHISHPSFANSNAAVRVAVDRLAGLGSRTNAEDRLVDALIACEAFFTIGSSSRAELAFRASLNAAMLSERCQLAMSPAQTLNFMLKAYDLRSRIVHGDEIRGRDLKLGQDALDINSWVHFSVEIVRRAIVWTFAQRKPGEKISVDWQSLYFSK